MNISKLVLKLVLFVCVVLMFAMCTKETFYTNSNATLKFSSDTIKFDTIFSTIGTPTYRLLVFNPYNQKIKISKIELKNGANSVFRMNVNGVNSVLEQNVEIPANDSIYIFVQAFSLIKNSDLPIVETDEITFETNNNFQKVELKAYSQDVTILKNEKLQSQTWDGKKPYLIIGSVTIDSLQTLTIKKGVAVYFRNNSNLYIKGTLQVEGEKENPVKFSDEIMSKAPGQWGGVVFLPGSKNNSLNYAILKNGTSGLRLGNFTDTARIELTMQNTIVHNMMYSSLLAINSKIVAVNCIVANAGTVACGLIGGEYEFYHCTIAQYYNWSSQNGKDRHVLYLSNYIDDPKNATKKIGLNLNKASFYNSIVYGTYYQHAKIDTVVGNVFKFKFHYCLASGKTDASDGYTNMIWAKDPKFKDPTHGKFEIDSLSNAKKGGDSEISKLYPLDIIQKNRAVPPSIGAYE